MPNNLYGIIIDGKLKTDSALFEGYKPVVYAQLPKFDQLTQYVIQGKIVDEKGNLTIGCEVKTVIPDVNPREMDMGMMDIAVG